MTPSGGSDTQEVWVLLIQWEHADGTRWLQRYDQLAASPDEAVDRALASLTTVEKMTYGGTIRSLEIVHAGDLEDVPLRKIDVPLFEREP